MRAQAAAEDIVSYFDPNSYVRWRPLRLVPEAILVGDYRQKDAVRSRIKVSPFPDTSFLATKTSYTVDESTESAIWIGNLEGTLAGRIEITILAGFSPPQFIIRIFNSPQTIGISPTDDTANGYVAVERNPHQEPWTN